MKRIWQIVLALTVMIVAIGWGGTTSAQAGCDPAYPDFCIAPPPPDLDCKDVGQQSFRVLSPDPHHFDGDEDGIGCEPPRQ